MLGPLQFIPCTVLHVNIIGRWWIHFWLLAVPVVWIKPGNPSNGRVPVQQLPGSFLKNGQIKTVVAPLAHLYQGFGLQVCSTSIPPAAGAPRTAAGVHETPLARCSANRCDEAFRSQCSYSSTLTKWLLHLLIHTNFRGTIIEYLYFYPTIRKRKWDTRKQENY